MHKTLEQSTDIRETICFKSSIVISIAKSPEITSLYDRLGSTQNIEDLLLSEVHYITKSNNYISVKISKDAQNVSNTASSIERSMSNFLPTVRGA